ncbi:MAG: hypothetical protein IPG33_12660 [Betaproteobacteria bacterium]|nr:hypothetical protein [Betaproteobacteria bacterium]
MPLSPNEIKERAVAFAHKWAGEDSERAEAQSFWNGFFEVFGVDRKRVAVFEKQVKMARAGEKLRHGRIDLFWKGTLLVEHKSGGADLDRAVDAAYGKKGFAADAERVAFLFDLYRQTTSLLPAEKTKRGRK